MLHDLKPGRHLYLLGTGTGLAPFMSIIQDPETYERFEKIVVAHGVRKVAATRAANAGATVAQLEAIFGWSGGTMASLYTRSADRKRLAIEAMHKLAGER